MKDYTYVLIFFLFFICIFTIFAVSSSVADTITVGPDGPPMYDYSSIKIAVLNAKENDTINVYPGTYTESLVIDKALNLVGIGGSGITTIITPSADQNTIEVTKNFVNISGFTIKNLGETFACIKLYYVTNCQIDNIEIQNGGNGLFIIHSNRNFIRNSNIENNNVGIYLSFSSNNMIYSNNIHRNNANGVFISAGCIGNTFYLNKFANNLDKNARDLGSNNWDYNSQGNYWDDYKDYDKNLDGIGDSPYNITGSNIDNFPLGYFLSSNPEAHITSIRPNPAAQGATITFNGHGVVYNGIIIGWEWYLNNVKYSNSKDFSTSSLTPGTYNVKFRVKDDINRWSEYATETLVVINQKPTAYILSPVNSSKYYYGQEINFSGYGIDPEGEITAYSWRSVPDEVSSSESYFIKSDLPVGNYSVFFKVKDAYDQWSDEKSIAISVLSILEYNQPPIANAGGPYSGKINTSIQFNGSGSYDLDINDTLTFEWDFGDGITGTGMSPIHIYTSEKRFTVNLTVIDSFGEISTDSTYVDITSDENGQNGGQKNKKTPGFEALLTFIAVICVIIINKKIKKKD